MTHELFPLYSELLDEVYKTNPVPDMHKMSSVINSLSSEKMIQMMIIIHHHAIVTGSFQNGKIPYEGKIFNGTKGVKYKISDLPIELQKIIWIFIDGNILL